MFPFVGSHFLSCSFSFRRALREGELSLLKTCPTGEGSFFHVWATQLGGTHFFHNFDQASSRLSITNWANNLPTPLFQTRNGRWPLFISDDIQILESIITPPRQYLQFSSQLWKQQSLKDDTTTMFTVVKSHWSWLDFIPVSSEDKIWPKVQSFAINIEHRGNWQSGSKKIGKDSIIGAWLSLDVNTDGTITERYMKVVTNCFQSQYFAFGFKDNDCIFSIFSVWPPPSSLPPRLALKTFNFPFSCLFFHL